MDVVIDAFYGKVPGSEAVRDFQKRLAAKMAADAQMSDASMAMMGNMNMQGMTEARKKMAEMDGMPVYSVMRMGGPGMAASSVPASQQAQPQPQQQEQQGGGGVQPRVEGGQVTDVQH